MNQRAALPPLLPFGLSPDEHFQQAVNRLGEPQPTERSPILDLDLEFAAGHTARSRGALRKIRQACVGALRELKRRWQPLTHHLWQFQTEAIRAATAKRDAALLVVLLSWADTSLPFGLVRGLPAVGFAPCYGVFPQQPAGGFLWVRCSMVGSRIMRKS